MILGGSLGLRGESEEKRVTNLHALVYTIHSSNGDNFFLEKIIRDTGGAPVSSKPGFTE